MDFRGRPFDFWGGYGWFQRKCPADWFRQEKSMQYIWEKNMRSCQPFSEWGKKRIWHLCKCHLSTKWLARDHDVVVSKTKVLHFKIENTPIKDTNGKRKFKRMLSFLLWTNESFSLWNCLSRNSTLFLHGGSECLACFEPTKAARFLKTLEVHSVLYDQRRVFVFKKEFLNL